MTLPNLSFLFGRIRLVSAFLTRNRWWFTGYPLRLQCDQIVGWKSSPKSRNIEIYICTSSMLYAVFNEKLTLSWMFVHNEKLVWLFQIPLMFYWIKFNRQKLLFRELLWTIFFKFPLSKYFLTYRERFLHILKNWRKVWANWPKSCCHSTMEFL